VVTVAQLLLCFRKERLLDDSGIIVS
jgi:hypothetical protein